MRASKELCKEIQESYLALCRKDPQEWVRVKDIMALAGHAKSTFYLNYENVESLRDELIEELAARVSSPFSRSQPEGNPAFSGEGFRLVLTQLSQERNTALLLIQQGGKPVLLKNLSFFLHRAITLRLKNGRYPDDSLPGCAALLSHGLLDLTMDWLEHSGDPEEIPPLCDMAEELFSRLTKN